MIDCIIKHYILILTFCNILFIVIKLFKNNKIFSIKQGL